MSVSFTLLPTMAAIIALVFTTSSSAPHAPSYGDPIPSAYAEKITVKRRCHSHPPAVATSSFSHAQMTAIPRPMRTSWPGAVSCLVVGSEPSGAAPAVACGGERRGRNGHTPCCPLSN